MGWAGVTSCGQKTPLIFIEGLVKVDQHIYLPILKDKVLLWVKKSMGNSGVTLQQDVTTSHTAKIVQSWCKENLRFFGSLPSCNLNQWSQNYGLWAMR